MPDRPLPNIAIVAVHGIGDQESHSSVRAVADLLLRLRAKDNSRYTTFGERPIRVPVRPAQMHDTPGPHPPEHQLMRDQLAEYQSTGEPYDTLRLDGQRLAYDNAGDLVPHANIHVYEMRWADLSRLRGRFLSVFGELYQLFFHVAHLGRLAIEQARLEHPEDQTWRAYHRAHELAVTVLTILVPALFLTTLASVTGLIALGLPAQTKPYVITALTALAVAGGGALITYRGGLYRNAAAWVAVPVLATLASGLAWRFVTQEQLGADSVHATHVDRAMLASWVALSGAALHAIYRAYDRRQPGALRIGIAAYAASAVASLAVLSLASTSAAIRNGVLNVFEVEMLAAIFVWGVLYAAGALSGLLGWRVAQKLAGAARDRAQRVAWTARVTLSISAASVLILSFVMWSALLVAYGTKLPAEQPTLLFDFFGPADSYAAVFHNVISVTAGPGMPLVLLVGAAVGVASLLALFPAVIQEVRAPHVGHSFKRGSSAADANLDAGWRQQDLDDRNAERLGWWLSTGLKVTVFSLTLMYISLFLAMPVMNLVQFATQGSIELLAGLQTSANAVILRAGTFVAGVQIGAVAISGWAGVNALGFRTMLDALLDVDSYMREHPRNGTPRGRIAERFASLLRYIAHWRGEKYGYKAIIFVTHSQGTVITTDMLNFLECEEDEELLALRNHKRGEPPAFTMLRPYLITMGSPLRDLYARAFPHLYGWVRGEHPPWNAPRQTQYTRDATRELEEREEEGRRVVAPAIGITASPDPYDLGVARWVNAYRSGDYVGRALWRTDMPEVANWWLRGARADARSQYPEDTAPMIHVSEDAVGSRRELCIGTGAHTHYWDETAKAIAMELDTLIDSALAVPVYPSPAARKLAIEVEG